jgi:peptidoglycan/LPS O-acetylase OafA/YrhL
VLAWKKSERQLAMALAILALCVAGFIGEDMLVGFFVWLAGFALVLTYSRFPIRGKASLVRYLAVASLGLLVCLGAARKQSWGPLGSDLFVGLTFAIALFGILQADFGAGNEHYARTARFFSGFSYSLYVLHFPLLLFLRGWLCPSARWEPDPIHLTYGLFIGTLVISFCWVVSIFTEGKTTILRDRLKTHIGSFGER